MDWYYAVDKQQHGPVSPEQLAELVRQGVVTGSTLVWHAGMGPWQPYSNVAGSAAGDSTPPGSAPAFPAVSFAPSPEDWAQKVVDEEVDLTVGECFAKGWEMFQRNMPVTIGALLLVFLAQMAINAVPILGPIASMFLTGPLYGGLMYYFVLMVRGEECRVGTAFAGFGPRFVPLMLAGLLIAVISVICMLPGFAVMIGGIISAGLLNTQPGQVQEAIAALSAGMICLLVAGAVLIMVVTMVVTMLLQFAYPLILDKGLDVMDAVKLSVRRGMKKWGTLLVLIIMGSFVSMLGFLLCGVGALFTVPWYLGAWAFAYEKLFPGETAKSSFQ
jgi:uncharacterized membrane protein